MSASRLPLRRRFLWIPAVVLCVLAAQPATAKGRLSGGLGHHPFTLPANVLFAHALGGIEGHIYTNSLEALEHNLALGARFFEVDFSFTADGDLVCFHRGLESHVGLTVPVEEVSTEEFLSHTFDGRFTLIDLRTLLSIMETQPQMYLITDTKDDFASSLLQIATVAASIDPQLIRRIIPQFYFADQWLDVARIEAQFGPFATVIFTLYRTGISDDAVIATVIEGNVPVVTMSTSRWDPYLVESLKGLGAAAMVHTVNGRRHVEAWLHRGFRGVYTDWFFTWERPVAFSGGPPLRRLVLPGSSRAVSPGGASFLKNAVPGCLRVAAPTEIY